MIRLSLTRYALLASSATALVLAFVIGTAAFAGLEFAQDACAKGMHVDRRTGFCKAECPAGQHWDSLAGCAYPYREGVPCPENSSPAPGDATNGSVCAPNEIPPR